MQKTTKKKAGRRRKIQKASKKLTSARNRPLRDFTEEAVKHYFRDLNGHKPGGELYGLVLGEVEPPLFDAVMDYTEGNQTRAAEILGMTRATLRKKLRQYELMS